MGWLSRYSKRYKMSLGWDAYEIQVRSVKIHNGTTGSTADDQTRPAYDIPIADMKEQTPQWSQRWKMELLARLLVDFNVKQPPLEPSSLLVFSFFSLPLRAHSIQWFSGPVAVAYLECDFPGRGRRRLL